MSILKTLSFIVNHPLNRRRKFRAILNFTRWQIGCRLIPGEYIYSWIKNSKIIAQKGETSATGNIYCGLYTFSEMAFVLHSASEDDLFIDVGSNIGCYTILACSVKGARGYSFEPISSTYDRMLNNLRLNDLMNRVKPFNMGISDKEEILSFTTERGTTNLVSRNVNPDARTVLVKSTTLDNVMSTESPTIIKIDVEGYETPVIKGAVNTLNKESINSVIIRLKGHGSRFGYDENEIFQYMKSIGFNSYIYDPFTRILEISDTVNPVTGNAIFIRNLSRVRDKIILAEKILVSDISF